VRRGIAAEDMRRRCIEAMVRACLKSAPFMELRMDIRPALAALLLLTACAGREAHPVTVTRITDSALDCMSIAREFEANEARVIATVRERDGQNMKNAALAAGAVIFLPTLFFMDLKGPERIELQALRARNQVLMQLAAYKRCPMPAPRVQGFYDAAPL
jgi:hypothetical protein